jgi:succinate-acetate transporter protein
MTSAATSLGARPEVYADGHSVTADTEPGESRMTSADPIQGASLAPDRVTADTPPVADPGPLGLAAFALTTFILSAFNAKVVGPPELEAVVLPVAVFYGGAVQVLAGMWEFKRNNTFAAVAFSSYGAFWLSLAAYLQLVAPGLPPEEAHTATGLFLLAWTVFTAYLLIASLRVNGMLATVFVLLFVTFALLTIGQLGTSNGVGQLGGWFGLVTAFAAWYGSAAGVINSTWGRAVLPVFPITKH